jgi:hypothetical protein
MNPVDEHFVRRDPVVRQIYDENLRAARAFGKFEEQPKKTSIHVRDRRLFKREQVSAHRWHLEVRLESPDDVDFRLTTLLERAYELAG